MQPKWRVGGRSGPGDRQAEAELDGGHEVGDGDAGQDQAEHAGDDLDAAAAERAAKFDRLDKDKHGKLTLEEYVSRQSDPDGAKKRFEKFDTNHDGFVTREEYINNGAKKPKEK